MGLTPLEGLVMGTRSGDLDPAVPIFLARAGRTLEEIDAILNRESGLKGLCGVNDMREVLRRAGAGDADAALALDVFCYRLRKYIGAYAAALGSLDAVIFTAGVGENAAEVRERACEGLWPVLGLEVDPARNRAGGGGIREVQSSRSRVKVMVVPTNEELEIADQARDGILASRQGRRPSA
jgi:acetate kinase